MCCINYVQLQACHCFSEIAKMDMNISASVIEYQHYIESSED